MKKKYSKKELEKLETEMKDLSRWADVDHIVSYKGPTSIRFSGDVLKKLHAISKFRKVPINRLVNQYVKPFVDGEYEILAYRK